MRKAANQRGRIARLELVKLAAVNDAGNHLSHVIRLFGVDRNHAVQFLRAVHRRHWHAQGLLNPLGFIQAANRLARQRQGMGVVLREVVGHA